MSFLSLLFCCSGSGGASGGGRGGGSSGTVMAAVTAVEAAGSLDWLQPSCHLQCALHCSSMLRFASPAGVGRRQPGAPSSEELGTALSSATTC